MAWTLGLPLSGTKDPMNADTLDKLPGEGDTRTTTEVRQRRECSSCGKPAQYHITYLLDNYRNNPASSAYGRDDCSRCSDAKDWACVAHRREIERDAPRGMVWCSTYSLAPHFAHLFLHWVEQ